MRGEKFMFEKGSDNMKSSLNPVPPDVDAFDIGIHNCEQQPSYKSVERNLSSAQNTETFDNQGTDQISETQIDYDHLPGSSYLPSKIPLLDLDSQSDDWLYDSNNDPGTCTATIPNICGLGDQVDLHESREYNKQETTTNEAQFGAQINDSNDSFYGEYLSEAAQNFSKDRIPTLDLEDVLEVIGPECVFGRTDEGTSAGPVGVAESDILLNAQTINFLPTINGSCTIVCSKQDILSQAVYQSLTNVDNVDQSLTVLTPSTTMLLSTTEKRKHHDLRRIIKKRHISNLDEDAAESGSDSDSEYSDLDNDDDTTSDTDAPNNLSQFCEHFLSCGIRTKPHYWQYNFQARGPKGQRLCPSIELKDSHYLYDFADPVFDNDASLPCKHSGKARRGEGNDPQPNPKKLLQLGSRISSLEKKFQAVSLKSSSSGKGASGGRTANREKNILASRICRLKKKAQHEANKLKLDGLKQEHGQLMKVLMSIVLTMDEHVSEHTTGSQCSHGQLCVCLDQYIRNHLASMIAGHTSEYVNLELEKAARFAISDNIHTAA